MLMLMLLHFLLGLMVSRGWSVKVLKTSGDFRTIDNSRAEVPVDIRG